MEMQKKTEVGWTNYEKSRNCDYFFSLYWIFYVEDIELLGTSYIFTDINKANK